MNSVLTKPKSLQELYRTYFQFANKFDFTSVLQNYIQSEEWKDRSQDGIWTIISKISDDIGAMMADQIVNYTQNVVDVNTCKIPQLIEHAKQLSYNLEHIRNSYGIFPTQIQCLIDIFSINPEYLIGNHKNHILSDSVIKDILIYIRQNSSLKTPFTNDDVIDKLLDNPHSLMDDQTYRNFIKDLFAQTLIDAITSPYSKEDGQPMVSNMLYSESDNQGYVLSIIDQYRSWVDRFITNEIDHPLNGSDLPNTIGSSIETIRNTKKISSKFNPYQLADSIYFNGLNPNNGLSEDELSLIEMVIDYHSKPKYDYRNQLFISDQLIDENGVVSYGSTKYSYYRELELCSYLKTIIFIYNNITDGFINLTYDLSMNKFVNDTNTKDLLKVCKIFSNGTNVVSDSNGNVVINYDIINKVADFLMRYVIALRNIRENMKTLAQKHAMRGSGALLVHIVNDYLQKELPFIRDVLVNDEKSAKEIQFGWEISPEKFKNYGNVSIIEYEDDNEYFNIDPNGQSQYSSTTNDIYWDGLNSMSDDDSLGVFSKSQIKNFYRNTLGMGILQQNQASNYDDICDFLVDLFKIGANPLTIKDDELYNPIDDIINKSEEDYGYTKAERVEVQQNTGLRKNQENQYLEYIGNDSIVGDSIYDMMNNRLFYWKNINFSSHSLHPFMYNLKLWNKLNNIIINGYRNYTNSDLESYLSSKVKFDELFGKFGECKNFWKYNILDLSGYTTRYEAAVKNEHLDDLAGSISKLTGYDGLFYPDAAKEFLDLYDEASNVDGGFVLPDELFKNTLYSRTPVTKFIQAIYSIYWQDDDSDTFYRRWYSHLNYTRSEYQKIAIQLWYWRDRIHELITNEYDITKYCLDVQGNSLILVSTFKSNDVDSNQYLIDLSIAQNKVVNNGNLNKKVSYCDNQLIKPNEMWIRWKSNPIAIPAFDVCYDLDTDDIAFNKYYRKNGSIELGQITHTNNSCNDNFKVVIENWKSRYSNIINDNRLPVFFDMEQSANVLILSSWKQTKEPIVDDIENVDEFGQTVYVTSTAKNPYHIISVERTSVNVSEYNWTSYGTDILNSYDMVSGWLFDSYQYCQANGSILIPMYKFDCSQEQQSSRQNIDIRMFVVPAQQLKDGQYVTVSRMYQLNDIPVDLNKKQDTISNNGYENYRFGHEVAVCKNTNVVFSAYDSNGVNKVRCAFLGNFVSGQDTNSYKVGSCGAMTRYEFDSQVATDLSLLKDKNYKVVSDDEFNRYIDSDIHSNFNSYDSLDKYVMVIDIDPSIDNKTLFNISSKTEISTYAYNILGDAGYIPHFAYQSLVGYSPSSQGGTSYTYRNEYLKNKQHMQFEMLGLSDNKLPEAVSAMQKMIVEDITDNCSTLINPAKLMDDIYRIWCENKGVRPRGQTKDQYFPNEYKEYINGNFTFDANGEYIWEIPESDLFEIDMKKGQSILDDYYVSILRVEDGDILNEKRYILQPTRVSEFILGVNPTAGLISDGNDNEFVKCNISPYQSANIMDDKFVRTQVVFTGTQNPFNYDENGRIKYSREQELQYGNGICGVGGIQLKLDVVTNNTYWRLSDFQYEIKDDEYVVTKDGTTYTLNVEVDDENLDEDSYYVIDENGNRIIKDAYKYIRPIVKFTKFETDNEEMSLTDRVQTNTNDVDGGQIMVILSYKNLDNIAKYHILNRKSNLYFMGMGSLPKSFVELGDDDIDPYYKTTSSSEGRNQFKYSDFRTDMTIKLIESGNKFTSDEFKDYDGQTRTISFTIGDVKNEYPPYYVEIGDETWYLEQDEFVYDTSKELSEFIYRKSTEDENIPLSVKYGAAPGKFKYAHRVIAKPTKYLDYLYVKNGGLSFKVNEESESFANAMSIIPDFYIDQQLKNKLNDLNDIQILKPYSTFIHQSEDPDIIKNCSNFNPLYADAILNYGVEQKDDTEDGCVAIELDSTNSSSGRTVIQLENANKLHKMALQLEDNEIDEYLKVYTNFVKVSDGDGDFHYDIYFNLQNLFNSPFEYISSVTGQPNVLILKDSYLCLSGDKFKKDKNGNNVIDEDKVESIKNGQTLTIYGQVKSYQNDKLVGIKTLTLFQYQVYNISDDKPKFLMNKIYDITKSTLTENATHDVKIEFSNILWTVKESDLEHDSNIEIICQGATTDDNQTAKNTNINMTDILCSVDNSGKKFVELAKDVILIQPIFINYDYNKDSDSRLRSISFDIVNDVIYFNNIPELCDKYSQERTLTNAGNPYYDHWSDSNMTIVKNDDGISYRITLNFEGKSQSDYNGYNFETIYLRWKIPSGFKIMDSMDKLNGVVFGTTAQNITIDCSDSYATTNVDVVKGNVVARIEQPGTMYLGLEHTTAGRQNGFVLNGMADLISNAISETNLKNNVKNKLQ